MCSSCEETFAGIESKNAQRLFKERAEERGRLNWFEHQINYLENKIEKLESRIKELEG
jgi:peptidoglycan hydrolase CwlO-like protein